MRKALSSLAVWIVLIQFVLPHVDFKKIGSYANNVVAHAKPLVEKGVGVVSRLVKI